MITILVLSIWVHFINIELNFAIFSVCIVDSNHILSNLLSRMDVGFIHIDFYIILTILLFNFFNKI